MANETVHLLFDTLAGLIFDVRFQVVFLLAVLIHWAWRLPRPKKGVESKAVFITGCDTGMGHRMARRFDQMGFHVFAGCLMPEGEGARTLKQGCSNKLHIVPLDITNEDQIKDAVAYVKANLPTEEKGLYCLINNAGVMAYMMMSLMTTEMCEEVINVNLTGTIRVTKHFLPLIVKAEGRIITITSILARIPLAQTSVYTATKHALNGFFSSFRYELIEDGVHIAMIEPGDFSRTTDIMQWTRSRLDGMWNSFSPEEQREKRHLYEEVKRKIQVQRAPPSEQEANYKYLLDDVEDAMLAEEPYWRYVSAPLSMRIKLWIARTLPEQISFRLTKRNDRYIRKKSQ